jgi:hypothetical protein
MSVKDQQGWITGEEFGRERRRLIAAGVPDDAPEFQALVRRVLERDDSLFERYGKPYLETHPGKWIAISLGGEVLVGDTAGEVIWEATETFGAGNFAMRKLADFPGHRILF